MMMYMSELTFHHRGWQSVFPTTTVNLQAVGNGRCESGAAFIHPAPSTVVRLFVAGSTGSEEGWMPVEGYTVVKSVEEADVILGHSEVVSASRGQLVARLKGDEWLANKSLFCKLARHKKCCAEGVDVRSEAAALLCEEPVVKSWRILLPSEKGSAVRPRVTRNKLELVRWAEVGPCVASKCELLKYYTSEYIACSSCIVKMIGNSSYSSLAASVIQEVQLLSAVHSGCQAGPLTRGLPPHSPSCEVGPEGEDWL